jgi:porin
MKPAIRMASLAGFLLAAPALAQPPSGTGPANPQGVQPPPAETASETQYSDGAVSAHLLGDLGGMRTTLHDMGIDIRANLINEFAGNTSGGLSQGGRNAGEFNFGADLNLGRMGLDPGGSIHITFTQRYGYSLSQQVIGNLVSVQEIYGTGQNFRLAELSFEQALYDNHLNIVAGRVITENDFATSPLLWDHASLYCVFQNNGICGTPVGVPVNSGYDAYPQSTWGARVRVSPVDTVFAQTGVYEVNPSYAESQNGLKFSTSDATGVFIPFEIGWRPGHTITGVPTTDGALPGDYRIGLYYDTSNVTGPLKNLPGQNLPVITGPVYYGRYGGWLTAAQTVWRQPTGKPGGTRSLSLFGALNLGDPDTALYPVYAELGAVLKGTFPGRDDDTIGLAVTDTEVNGHRKDLEAALLAQGYAVTGVQNREIAFEVNYSAAVYPGISIEPGIQFIVHPGALTEVPNALVFALRTAVKF